MTTLRRFKQVNRKPECWYVADEIHFVQEGPEHVRMMYILSDGTKLVGPSMSRKHFDMNMDGYQVTRREKKKDAAGAESVISIIENHPKFSDLGSWEEMNG